MAKFDVDVQGVTYEVDAPDENTAWKWAVATHKAGPEKPKSGVDLIPTGGLDAPAAKNDQPSVLPEIGRQVGLTARHGIEGVGGVADFLASPFRAGLSAVTGRNIEPMAPKLADVLGLPKPQDRQERIVGDIARTMAGGGAFGAGSGLAAKGTEGVTKAILEQMAAKPGMQMLASAGSGAGSGVAREEGAGPVGQIVAGLAGGAMGASLPAVANTVSSAGSRLGHIVDQLLPGGATKAAGRVGVSAAGDKVDDIIAELSKAGRTETAKQASVPTQSREFPGLMKVAEENAPTQTGMAIDSQAARRASTLGSVKPDLAAAETARKSAAAANYKDAYAQMVKADPELARMASNPYFKKAMSEVSDLASAKGVTFANNPTQFLHYVKIGLDKLMRKTGDTALAGTEKEAVTGLQKNLVDWIGRKNPKYEFARAQNELLSKPVEQSKTIQAIQDVLEGVAGKERASPFLAAVNRGEENLVKGAVGFNKDELSSVLTPRQMKVVTAIENQIEKNATANRFAGEGSKKAAEIFGSSETPITIPNILSRPVMVANAIIRKAEGYGSKRTLDELSRLNLNPREFAEVLSKAKPSVRESITKELIMQKAAIGMIGEQ